MVITIILLRQLARAEATLWLLSRVLAVMDPFECLIVVYQCIPEEV